MEAPTLDQIGSDAPDVPPEVERFWHVYRELRKLGHDLNHHRSDCTVAIRLADMEKAAIENGLRLPPRSMLHKALRLSRSPKFLEANKAVRSVLKNNTTVKAWVFELAQPGQEV